MKNEQRVLPEPLNAFATAVYTAVGMPEADARLAADTLVQAHSNKPRLQLVARAADLELSDPRARRRHVRVPLWRA